MADVYASIADADQDVQHRLAAILERRAGDPQQQAMLEVYLGDIVFPAAAEVLDVGCGTGPVSRALAARQQVARVVGVDPSPVFLAIARNLAGGSRKLSFVEGDCRALPCGDASFDMVVFHTTLSHVPGCEQGLAEAYRVLRPGGTLAVFDGNYTTTSLSTGAFDPLQSCADAAMAALVHDSWLVPRLPRIVAAAGFSIVRQRSLGLVETDEPDYLLSIVDRGADLLAGAGRIGAKLAHALKQEARQRVEEQRFFGSITYASLVAVKGGDAQRG